MKLSDLKSNINEVKIGPPQGDKGFDINKYQQIKKKVTSIEGYDVYEYDIDNTNYVFSIEKDDEIFGWCGGWSNHPKQLILIAMLIYPQYQGKGIGTILFKALFEKLNWIIISDSQIAPAIATIYTKLAKIFPQNIKFCNIKTGEEYPYTSNINDPMYNNDDYRIILESIIDIETKKLNESIQNSSIFEEFVWFTSNEALTFWKEKGIDLL